MIPIVARTSEEVLRLVPKELREASLALGATESRTILRVVIPAARNGIITGIVLAMARVAGETAPLLMTALATRSLTPTSPSPWTRCPAHLQLRGSPYQAQINQAYAGSLVLIVLILLTSFAIRWATGGFKRVDDKHFHSRNAAMGTGRAAWIRIEIKGVSRVNTSAQSECMVGHSQALHDINLTIESCGATAIIGPSGCGKSTFVRCLNRMQEEIAGGRVEGEVLIDGSTSTRGQSSQCMYVAISGWCFSGPIHSRHAASSRMWRSAFASTDWRSGAALKRCRAQSQAGSTLG